jgi:hypothetical protein
MGTRNLTMVIHKEETKIAQYGQWDGYPEGQGVTILNFVRKKNDLKKLRAKLEKVRFGTKDDEKKLDKFLKSIGSNDGWMTMDQAEKYHKQYPYASRDIGGEILEMVAYSKDEEIVLTDSTSFAADSLFCEWAYVVDLDKNVLECYSGYNKEPLGDDERFKTVKTEDGSKYTPIRCLKKYDLNALPTKRKFISELKKREKETANVE